MIKTPEEDYVTVPQNDLQQIEQIVIEYENPPSKGLVHGLQKDAIQNGVGARLPGSEPASFRSWKFTFELLKINGKYALSFWDEGTTGLTGDILSCDKIELWSDEERLTSDQRLSRFLTRFESGQNIGPGTFGRGKLIFQAASQKAAILCDSLRYNDGEYIAFERKIMGTRLKQTRMPKQGDEAKLFIREKSGGQLPPLTYSGTRITILNLKDDVIKAFKKSFTNPSPNGYAESFAKMIEETWWEILDKFDAEIWLKWGERQLRVKLTDPLKSLATVRDHQSGWRIYKKTRLDVVVGGTSYKAVELKFGLAPEEIDEDLRDIWLQRKRMKIGSIVRGLDVPRTVKKRIFGYVIIDRGLEDLIEDKRCEGPTHYGFALNKSPAKQIKETVQHHFEEFKRELGFRSEGGPSRARQDMLDVANDLNENANNLGLISEFSSGKKNKDVEINIHSFKLPNEGSSRVEIDEDVGPIVFKITNSTRDPKFVALYLTACQRGAEGMEKSIHREEIDLGPNESRMVEVGPFQFNVEEFRYEEGILIVAKMVNRNSGTKISQVSRMVWFGIEEPPRTENPFAVTAYRPLFPRHKSLRVELNDTIQNIKFNVSNKSAFHVKINVDLVVRKAKSPSSDVQIIEELVNEREILLLPMSEREFAHEAVIISPERFGFISEGPANHDERRCEIFFSVRSSENIPDLELTRGKHLGKKKIEFFLGMDRPGVNIFKAFEEENEPKKAKRSDYSGDRASGYVFILNIGHSSYRFAEEYGRETAQEYIKEQMLRQAYTIAIENNEFRGVAQDFEDDLTTVDLSPAESFKKIEELIGKALLELGGR